MVPGEEYPNARISSFAEVFAEVGLGRRGERIGIVGLSRMPLGVYELLCKSLPDVELVDVTPEYERFRECKSPWEIGEIRRDS
jgi:Xaa-Pro aminopeptidase